VRSRRWLGFAQWLLGLLVVVFVTRFVVANWDQVRHADLAWRLSVPYLVGGVALVWVAFALLAESWRRMVGGWGHAIGPIEAARIWLLSSMAKYVPGKVWALAGMAVLARERGVPPWAAAGSAVLLQILALGTGALTVATTGIAATGHLGQESGLGYRGLLIVAGVAAGLILVLLWPPVARRLLAALTGEGRPQHTPGASEVGLGIVTNLIAWLAYGAAFWLFARGSLPQVPLTLIESVSAYTASYVAGIIAPLAPAGLGVREGVLILVLRERTGLASALALAAVARLGMTAAEVAAVIPFLLKRRLPQHD
jgi:hypothetical protein